MNIPYQWIDAFNRSQGLSEFRSEQEAGLRFAMNSLKGGTMFAHNNGRKTDLTIQPAKNGLNILMGDGSEMVLLSVSDSDMSFNFFKNGRFTGKSVTLPNGKQSYRMDATAKVARRAEPIVINYTSPVMKTHIFPRSSIELLKETPSTIIYRSLEPIDKVYLEAYMGEEELSLRFRDKHGKDEFSVTSTKRNGREVIIIRDWSKPEAGFFEFRPLEKTLTFYDRQSGFVIDYRGYMKVTNVDKTTKTETVTDLGCVLNF